MWVYVDGATHGNLAYPACYFARNKEVDNRHTGTQASLVNLNIYCESYYVRCELMVLIF